MKPRTSVTLVLALGVGFGYWCLSTNPTARIDSSYVQVLADFDSHRAREALLRHLASSAEWRVWSHKATTQQNVVVDIIEAEYRGSDNPTEFADHRINVALKFSPSSDSAVFRDVCQARSKLVDVPLSRLAGSNGALCSTLAIKFGSIVLEIYECNIRQERPLTTKAMQRIAYELTDIRDNIEEVERVGYLRKWLPKESIRQSISKIPIEITGDNAPGVYHVVAYVNPQEKGYVTLRTFNDNTNVELNASVNSWRTNRFVGWSPRSDDKFFVDWKIVGPTYLTESERQLFADDQHRNQALAPAHEIRVEVWFHGIEDRKLLESTVLLAPFVR